MSRITAEYTKYINEMEEEREMERKRIHSLKHT